MPFSSPKHYKPPALNVAELNMKSCSQTYTDETIKTKARAKATTSNAEAALSPRVLSETAEAYRSAVFFYFHAS